MNNIRSPIVAGQFYPENFEELDKLIRDCFEHKLGPGAIPVEKQVRSSLTKAIIAPHAGYVFSGPCAAWAYKEIAEAAIPEFFLMLGPSHAGGISAISNEDWETPFGVVRAEKEIADLISSKTGIPINNHAHHSEHSIEVQLPILQFTCKSRMDKIRIVPLMVSHDVNPALLGEKLADLLVEIEKKHKKKAVIITSSDFTHYGLAYGYIPFQDNPKENMKKLDLGAVDKILKKDSQDFLAYVENTGATICGTLPIAVMLNLIEKQGKEKIKAKLLQYYSSGDISKDHTNAVGYAAISFR